ncbi:hypothetical protein FACS189420_0140 [Bacteroidia bacterium]|nr:hypothetical protein FACS18947_0020 [Bacteroidia bacterium]GHV70169.1 hypothetical protein FACS189420_0140 [Bacteroidia bacterium]
MNTKGENILVSFLELLKVKHTKSFSNRYFGEHPHKYNLFGISKMLSDYSIENGGTKVADKEKDIFNIQTPFIAHTGSDFATVYKVEPDKVHYIWKGKDIAISVEQFLQTWSGFILLAESSENSIEPGYKENRKKELLKIAQISIFLIATCLILVLGYISNSLFKNPGLTFLTVLNLLGVYIGYLLVLKQLHIHSEYADKICSLFKQSDCNNVLESKAAKLGDFIGWSEIGLGYFIANTLIILFLPHLISYLAIINILVLPYSFWSVWYQKVKAKQWCALCLIVQVLFWLVFAVNLIFGYIQIPDFNIVNWLLTSCIFVVPMLGINMLIPKLSEGNKVSQLNQEINSIKADENVLATLLKKRPHYEANKSDSQILFGNPDAKLFVTILTNPFCNPCAKMHKRVEKLLQEMNGKICIQYIFSSFNPDLDFANKSMIAVYLEKKVDTAMQIYSEWFEKGKIQKEEFFKNFQLNIDSPGVEREFQKHEAWKAKTKLRATPTILVNGYQLPDNYKIEDLRYFTEFNVNVK